MNKFKEKRKKNEKKLEKMKKCNMLMEVELRGIQKCRRGGIGRRARFRS